MLQTNMSMSMTMSMSNSTTASLSEETSGGGVIGSTTTFSPRTTDDRELYRFNPLQFRPIISSSCQHDDIDLHHHYHHHHQQQQQQKVIKKKRNLPGNPDPDAEVVALSPKTLMATNRFVCEICNKGFQRDQNLQLHRRGHNLPWKLRQKNSKEIVRKRVYICPEPTCVHNHPSRALGDLTGIKKHFCRKHGEKVWKCDKCSKKYAVMSDWKAHAKTCGTREYKCDCGTLFSRKDSFVTHRAFCDALAEESARIAAVTAGASGVGGNFLPLPPLPPPPLSQELLSFPWNQFSKPNSPPQAPPQQAHLSATELLQKATTMGFITTTVNAIYAGLDMGGGSLSTRNFLGGGSRVVECPMAAEEADPMFLSGLDLANNNNKHGINGFLSQQQWRS